MFGRSAAGASAARRPVCRQAARHDPAFERSRRRLAGSRAHVEEFQSAAGSRAEALALRADCRAASSAAHIFCPSEYLQELVARLGPLARARERAAESGAPGAGACRRATSCGARFELDGRDARLRRASDRAEVTRRRTERASRAADGSRCLSPARALIAEASSSRRGTSGSTSRVRFLGAQPRDRVLELFRAADASVLSSSWENFPHTVVEALAVGTPVISQRRLVASARSCTTA